MTNTEINKRIAKLLNFSVYHITKDGALFIMCDNMCDDNMYHQQFDPCNNWNQLMPLVVEHFDYYQIKKYTNVSVVMIKNGERLIAFEAETPQIALCSCLIEVLEAEEIEK